MSEQQQSKSPDPLNRARVARQFFQWLEEGYALAMGLQDRTELTDEDHLMLMDLYHQRTLAAAAECLRGLRPPKTEATP